MNSSFHRVRLIPFLFLLVATTIGSGCLRSKGVIRGSYFETRNTRYRIDFLPVTWTRMSLAGADLAFANEKNGSTLLVNSMCSEKSDAPLIALTFHLLLGMTEQKILEQKNIQKSHREGLQTLASAKVDGVERSFKIFVLKKDYCIYDIVLSTSPKHFENDAPVFDRVLEGFDVPSEAT